MTKTKEIIHDVKGIMQQISLRIELLEEEQLASKSKDVLQFIEKSHEIILSKLDLIVAQDTHQSTGQEPKTLN